MSVLQALLLPLAMSVFTCLASASYPTFPHLSAPHTLSALLHPLVVGEDLHSANFSNVGSCFFVLSLQSPPPALHYLNDSSCTFAPSSCCMVRPDNSRLCLSPHTLFLATCIPGMNAITFLQCTCDFFLRNCVDVLNNSPSLGQSNPKSTVLSSLGQNSVVSFHMLQLFSVRLFRNGDTF